MQKVKQWVRVGPDISSQLRQGDIFEPLDVNVSSSHFDFPTIIDRTICVHPSIPKFILPERCHIASRRTTAKNVWILTGGINPNAKEGSIMSSEVDQCRRSLGSVMDGWPPERSIQSYLAE